MDALGGREKKRIYLAGPDVFLQNAQGIASEKRAICETFGFVGVSPLDSECDLAGLDKREAGLLISRANEELMRGCDLLVANMTPFRGPGMDGGTAFEMGYMRALGRPVLGYTNVAGTLHERTVRFFPDATRGLADGSTVDGFEMRIEDHGFPDNLMMVGAIEASGGHVIQRVLGPAELFTDLAGFRECVRWAADHL